MFQDDCTAFIPTQCKEDHARRFALAAEPARRPGSYGCSSRNMAREHRPSRGKIAAKIENAALETSFHGHFTCNPSS